jgi:hypothetical protein
MDSSTLASGSIGGVSVALILGIAYILYNAINHRRCRSMCCNKEISASIDIENTTPPIVAKLQENFKPEESEKENP